MAKFVKGQSGNPGGRPKDDDIKALAREHTPAAIARLAKVVKTSKNDKAAVSAADVLLNRAYGKPAQQLEVTTRRAADEIPEDLVDAAIERLAAAVRSTATGGDAGATPGQSEPEQTPPVSTVH